MEIDFHGYHPAEIVFNGVLSKILQQVWEMGESDLTLIHGHGRNRGITPGFVKSQCPVSRNRTNGFQVSAGTRQIGSSGATRAVACQN